MRKSRKSSSAGMVRKRRAAGSDMRRPTCTRPIRICFRQLGARSGGATSSISPATGGRDDRAEGAPPTAAGSSSPVPWTPTAALGSPNRHTRRFLAGGLQAWASLAATAAASASEVILRNTSCRVGMEMPYATTPSWSVEASSSVKRGVKEELASCGSNSDTCGGSTGDRGRGQGRSRHGACRSCRHRTTRAPLAGEKARRATSAHLIRRLGIDCCPLRVPAREGKELASRGSVGPSAERQVVGGGILALELL
eukprot:scaffold23748_cov174-Isochrysis_galbana.AAC.1